MEKAKKAYMMFNIDADTKAAAKFYADIDSSRTVKADDFALKNHQHKCTEKADKPYASSMKATSPRGQSYNS